jgi:blue copper oxidase
MLGMGGMSMPARAGGGGMGRMRMGAHAMGINGRPFAMDRVDFSVKRQTTEIWEIVADEMAHPFHIHGVNFRILSNDGRKPPTEQAGLKDVVLVRDRAEILVRFEHAASPAMPFMYHCHILEHEDHGMMGQFAVA